MKQKPLGDDWSLSSDCSLSVGRKVGVQVGDEIKGKGMIFRKKKKSKRGEQGEERD